ncbi:MAG: phenylacetate--CoA ligase family protein, partial [Candidatus Binatia bacterium]
MWNHEMETLPRAELEKLQGGRLRDVALRVYRNVPFYRSAFDRLGVAPDEIRGVEDLAKLPFTRKQDFRDQYPFGLFAVPREQVVRIHASSGTTGKPTVVGYTAEDIATWAEVCARSLAAAGAEPGDVFQNAYGYGLFTGGLGMHYGGERMGLAVVPVSGGNTERQLLLIRDFHPKILACTPSYALVLADAWSESGGGEHGIRSFLLGAEPWT